MAFIQTSWFESRCLYFPLARFLKDLFGSSTDTGSQYRHKRHASVVQMYPAGRYIVYRKWYITLRMTVLVSVSLCVVKILSSGTPCTPFILYRCFGGTCRFHLEARRISQARNQHEAVSVYCFGWIRVRRSWSRSEKYSNEIILFLFAKLTDCFAVFSQKCWIWRGTELCHVGWCTSPPNIIPSTQRLENQSFDISDRCAFRCFKPINVSSFPWSLTATYRATAPGILRDVISHELDPDTLCLLCVLGTKHYTLSCEVSEINVIESIK
jgi:hypothetical protein